VFVALLCSSFLIHKITHFEDCVCFCPHLEGWGYTYSVLSDRKAYSELLVTLFRLTVNRQESKELILKES